MVLYLTTYGFLTSQHQHGNVSMAVKRPLVWLLIVLLCMMTNLFYLVVCKIVKYHLHLTLLYVTGRFITFKNIWGRLYKALNYVLTTQKVVKLQLTLTT